MESMERGLAIQCHPQQRAIDQVLPIYLKDGTAKMDKTKMTYCGIRVKNRKDDRTVSNYMATFQCQDQYKRQEPVPHATFQFERQRHSAEQATQQASFLFQGLNSFTFLSPEVRSALHKLLNIRTNLVTRHAGDPVGLLYAKDFMLCSEQC
ncbi:uncharacterized protein VP01_11313g1 [Puccinia sorghi]|uniref:Uncharacterized protein n=1 Tax=Puccinia sorghi TaxID=27349 RepID=A0A0L6VTK1_9BASI|nr:uncharacterized protein VP01_11313g1 [Puccinia sorghi]